MSYQPTNINTNDVTNDINAGKAPNNFNCAELFYHDKQAFVP